MSHLSTYSNDCLKTTERSMLLKSLREIEVELDFNNRTIRNTWIESTVDAAIVYKGKRIAAGLNFKTNEDGTESVEVVGDFYGTGLNQEAFTNQIAQVYKKNDIINKCEEQRWYIDEENVTMNDKGEYVIQAYRYAE